MIHSHRASMIESRVFGTWVGCDFSDHDVARRSCGAVVTLDDVVRLQPKRKKVMLMTKNCYVILLSALLLSHSSAQISTEALLDTIQHTAFNFFWQEANPSNGLIRDRGPGNAPSSIASVGFGLSAICIGVDHGWVTRAAARDRVLTTLTTFWTGPQGGGTSGYIGRWGLFYHFLDMNDATRTWTCELSTIDTGLLLAGIIDARQYFNGSDSMETRIRALADSIYYRMNWDLMRNFNPGIMLGWHPETGFIRAQWIGYNEATIMYILALGSPTYPVDYTAWQTWTQGYQPGAYYGYSYIIFPPLFGHQYSHCWIDFRAINEPYMAQHGLTYFENSRRATLAQRAYSIANPGRHAGYSDSLWGITASDTPTGYRARGAPPPENDDGTITPTAPISSIPFAPDECIRVARNMWNNYRSQLWLHPYGFRDAFNLNVNWWDPWIIGIDQGPMIIMIENYRTGRVWQRFMSNPDVQRGLQRAGFTPVLSVADGNSPNKFELHQNFPNPFNPATTIQFSIPVGAGHAPSLLKVYDVLGRDVATLVDEVKPAGTYSVNFDASRLSSGVYYYKLTAGTLTATRKMIVTK
jgi:hypothetical protein